MAAAIMRGRLARNSHDFLRRRRARSAQAAATHGAQAQPQPPLPEAPGPRGEVSFGFVELSASSAFASSRVRPFRAGFV